MSIEATSPLDQLDDERAERVLSLVTRLDSQIRNSTAVVILIRVATETLLAGESRTPHKAYQRQCGVCRRTVDAAIKTLKRRRLIERVGTTDTGSAVYRAILDAGQADGRVV